MMETGGRSPGKSPAQVWVAASWPQFGDPVVFFLGNEQPPGTVLPVKAPQVVPSLPADDPAAGTSCGRQGAQPMEGAPSSVLLSRD